MEDSKSFYSAIPSALTDKALKKGSLLSFTGLPLLIAPGIIPFTAPTALFLSFLGLFLIARGLLSHKALKKLQSKPYKLVVNNEGLEFFKGEKITAKIPFSEISELSYEERGEWFGIVANKTVFFPYFQRGCLTEIVEVITEGPTSSAGNVIVSTRSHFVRSLR